LASDAAFGVVFGVFVVAMAALGFLAIRWGVRKDRPGRAEWRRRHLTRPDDEATTHGSAPLGFGDEAGSRHAGGDRPS